MKAFELSLFALASTGFSAAVLVGSSVTTDLGTFTLTKGAACACAKLSHSFGDVISPHGANYTTQAADRYWDVRADLSPACIFLPSTPKQVAEAVSIFESCNAQFAVRGGGHMNVRESFRMHVYRNLN
jgi:hypothetical protein